MDSMIHAAARALAAGDPFAALNRVALREDASALALRGIAMAQLGDLERARILLRRASRAFGSREALARARCVLAECEIALVMRDLSWPVSALEAAQTTLERHGDRLNGAYARHLVARRYLLVGRLHEAERSISEVNPTMFPAAFRAAYYLVVAGIAIRRIRAGAARHALAQAADAAGTARIEPLAAEVERAIESLDKPAARLVTRDGDRPIALDEVERLMRSPALIVDACRNAVRIRGENVSLATRPVLFALVRALAEAWPSDVPREVLLSRAFGARHVDDSHRARLRVEIGRLRSTLESVASIAATARGFALIPANDGKVVVLARPIEEKHGAVLALLDDGEAWSSSALAHVLSVSSRTIQRALDELAREHKVEAVGLGRARRWMMPPIAGFTTTLLLPGALQTE